MQSKLISYSLCFLLVFLSFSCSDDFITIKPITSAPPENFFTNQNDFRLAVDAVYNGLQSTNTYGRFYYMLMEARSDNTDMTDLNGSSGEYSQIDLFGETVTNSAIQSSYQGSYTIINRANLVLEKLSASSVVTGALRKQYAGESLFLRGLTYFNLVRLFGGVPLTVQSYTDPNQASKEGRASVATIYAQIETDLKAAADSLQGITYGASDLGRVTGNAVNALLGKVYLTQSKWNDALTALNKVQGSLAPDYASLFNLATVNNAFATELIFAVRYKKGVSPSVGNNYLNNMTKTGDNVPSTDMKTNAYESGDLRKTISISAAGFVNKYADPTSSIGDSGNNFPVLRYADVLLMIAEASNELNYDATGTGVAFTNLNAVRQRAGLAPLTSATLSSQEAFRDAIFKERRVELAFENHRWFDLMRYNKGLPILQAHLTSRGLNGTAIGQNRFLFPMPAAEVSVHNDPENFPQNPGY